MLQKLYQTALEKKIQVDTLYEIRRSINNDIIGKGEKSK